MSDRPMPDVLPEQALLDAKADAWDEGVCWVVDMYDASAYLANNPYRVAPRDLNGGAA